MFIVGFLTPNDYVNPQNFNCENRDVRMVEFNLNDKAKFKMYVDEAIN
jgi:hypothetical protein